MNKNYHEILGVKRGASREEITSRWLLLKKQYQSIPREDGGTREKICEINEAYRNLKSSAVSHYDFDVKEYYRSASWNKGENGSGTKGKRTFLYSAILGLILLVAGSVYIFQRITIEIRWNPRGTPKSVTASPIMQAAIGSPMKPEEPRRDGTPEKPLPPAFQAFQASARQEKPKPVLPEPSKAVSHETAPPIPKGELKLVSQKPADRGVRQSLILPPPTVKKASEKPLQSISLENKVVGQEKSNIEEPARFVEPEGPKSTEPNRERRQIASLQGPAAMASEQEVRKFLDEYVRHYNQKDIENLISFFSTRAIQNQKDDLGRMMSIYKKFFDQMEAIRYEVSIGTIERGPNMVEVRGDYELEGTLAKGGKRHWRGQIQWALAREDGKLRIVSLDYQPQSSR